MLGGYQSGQLGQTVNLLALRLRGFKSLPAHQRKIMYKRIIIKVGTTNLTSGKNTLDKHYLSLLVNTITQLHKQNLEILLVTSGAMGASKEFLSLDSRRKKGTSTRQMMAAVGQIYLMKTYWDLFQKQNIVIAQALLTRDDFTNRQRYLNLRNTLLGLLRGKVIPIINENDVVYTEELEGTMIGDNDTLSALLASATDADLLIILSDIDGLYTANPHKDATAQLIPVVKNIDTAVEGMIDEDMQKLQRWGSGAGGMNSKIKAAKIAIQHGTEVVIANGANPSLILDILERKEKKSTRFLPDSDKKSNWKKWLTTCLVSEQAKVIIDKNAETALQKNKSLLPVGIVQVAGKAERGDLVEIYSEKNCLIAKGLLEYSLLDLNRIKQKHSAEIESILGYSFGDEAIHKDNLVLII